MKHFGYILALSMIPFWADAQQISDIQTRVENHFLTVTSDKNLVICMDVIIPAGVKISSDQMFRITPILKSKSSYKNHLFPAIYVYGRRRDIITQRDHQTPTNAYKIMRRKRDELQTVNYLARIPFQDWMQSSELELRVDLYGCSNKLQSHSKQFVAQLNLERYTITPRVAFLTPQVEAVKSRSEEGKAYLDFAVNQITIDPTYRRNTQELSKIIETINLVKNDKNTSFTNLRIIGYASPEGNYAINARLAQGRAEELKKYILGQHNINPTQIHVSSVPEDWENLRLYVENSTLAYRDEILAIIDNKSIDYDSKEQHIKSISDGRPYAELLRDCYPALRHSDYEVQYTVRGFTVEEAKEIIYTNPQLLSLEEMFRVAQTYEQGSDKFNELFDVAVRMFPKDLIANINAAAIELKKGDLLKAERYLDRSDSQNAATLNNRGVLAILQNNLDKAEAYLKQAQAKGSEEATINLEEIAKKRENNALLGGN